MADDPNRGYFGHPILPTGFNSWAIGGDEVDGPGANEEIWPYYVDTFTGLSVSILTDEMMQAFELQCPDYAPPCEIDTLVVPREVDTVMIRAA